MSNYKTKARRPGGTEFEDVDILDNYYGPRRYGVRFYSSQFEDGIIFSAEECTFINEEKNEDQINPTHEL